MRGLTDKQRRMLEFIGEFMDNSAMAPTVYEIADNFKIKTSTVFAHLRALQRKNYLTRSSKARSISLNKPRRKARKHAATNSPLPVPMIGNDGAKRCELFCDPSLIGSAGTDKSGIFALRVNGQELKDIGILDGDIVVVKPSTSVKNGDLVVSAIEGETIIRSFKQSPDAPAEQMPIGIKGVVVALQRKFPAA